jgi:iron complex transport system substrate-binding protein
MIRRYLKKGAALMLFLLAMIIISACQKQALIYTMTVDGEITQAGAIRFLDYTITVYKDEASNSCGDCKDQPVHLYVGASEKEVAEAIVEVVTRADDLWEVSSVKDGQVILKEKDPGSVEEIPTVSIPSGLTISVETSGRNIKTVTNTATGANTNTAAETSDNPQRLAAVYGPSYELLTMLGAEDKIVVRADVQTEDFPWAKKVFSRISQVPILKNVHTSVNFEELVNYAPDIVYTFPRQNELDQLASAGIDAVPGETTENLSGVKEQVETYANTLGDEAKERAKVYCDYFDEKLAWVTERTSSIAKEDRPDVYYAGVDILTTYGKYSDMMEVIEAAGGNPVSNNLNAGSRTQIDYEQLMKWNPDVIFIDHGGINDGKTVEELKSELQTDSIYQSLTAVKNQQIYLSPSGVFYWDMGIQKILLVMHMAKILHPDLFQDLDMKEEVVAFYKEFYQYELSIDDAARILNRENPE